VASCRYLSVVFYRKLVVQQKGAMMEKEGLDFEHEGITDSVLNVPAAAKKEVATTALQSLGSNAVEAKREIATTALQTLGPDAVEAKKDILTVALQTLPMDATEARTEVINAAINTLPPGADAAKKEVALAAVQSLAPAARDDLVKQLQELSPTGVKDLVEEAFTPTQRQSLVRSLLPEQGVTNRIWLIIVGAFAIVFVSAAFALFLAVFLDAAQIDILLTVVTTVAGILAGFISGRASTGG
jgi:hypothetical protein